MPRFSPEHFVIASCEDPLKRKQLKIGLEQLSEEGAVQMFFDRLRLSRDPILGAVGVLQFEVIQHRLQSEYGVKVSLQPLPYKHARWVTGETIRTEQVRASRADHLRAGHRGPPADPVRHRLGAARRRADETPNLTFIAAVQPGRSGGRVAA